MKAITGTVITYNEADHIADCINSLKQVCDEIIVVDSLSDDDTVSIAESLGARVTSQAYLGEGKQRQMTEHLATNDWILALDADERLDDAMRDAVLQADLSGPGLAYAFNRKSYVGRHWIKGPGFYPDFITRLYNRTRSGYADSYGHAGVNSPNVARLEGHILHYTYDDLSDWIAKINQVSSLDARGMFENNVPPSRFKPMTSALAAAFRQLILRGGILHGKDAQGVVMTSMFRAYLKYWKLNELHEQARGPESVSDT